ncbi:hypothetical protein CDL15_Pgr026218 [Punica granatum]|uniref:Uncharacterized protein n=1 Tax=Punica granatum TaxID=22663 RepID=A0A218VR77_PUNGR|nr:hypothetical protein CDL15_Pgr026218 [Punica granatum]PKI78492.1 hypothetical protein CRG98_001132 [Punica granatum]
MGACSGELSTRRGRERAGTGAAGSSVAVSGPRASAGGCAQALVTSIRGRRTCGSVDVHACTQRDVRGARAQVHERVVTGAERVRELTSMRVCARAVTPSV